MGTHWLFNNLDEACALHLPRFSGSLCGFTVPMGPQPSECCVVQCHRDMIHVHRDAERQETDTHSLNWQKSKMIDWWIRSYYEQMGGWDEGVRGRKKALRRVNFPHSWWSAGTCCNDLMLWKQSGLIVMVCVHEVFVSSMLTCFHVSAYVYGCPYKATVTLSAALQVGRSKEQQQPLMI